jgi:hypothetical protein
METYTSLQKLVTESNNRLNNWQFDLFKSAGNLNKMLIEKLDPPRDIIKMHDKSFCRIALAKPFFDNQENGNLSRILLTENNYREFIKYNILNFSILLCFPTSESNKTVSTFKFILGVRFSENNSQYSIYDREFQQEGDWMVIDDIFSKIIEILLSDTSIDPYYCYKQSHFGF